MSQFTEKFIESIRLENSQIFLFEFHKKRINNVFFHFKMKNIYDFEKYICEQIDGRKGKNKIRIIYDLNGEINIEVIPYFLKKYESFELINADKLQYPFKFENRLEINKLKSKSNSDEVIFHKNGEITDTSISNIVFKKGENWFTPRTTLLNGVMREYLLETKQISIDDINLRNIWDFSHFQMINAMIPLGTKEYKTSLIKNLDN